MRVRTWHLDTALCALFVAAGAGMIWLSRARADAAVREYGRNVDSGAIEFAVAVVYLLPAAVPFGIAAVAGARGWRLGRWMHWFAVLAAVCPVAYDAVGGLR